jgi:hypothetical protein
LVCDAIPFVQNLEDGLKEKSGDEDTKRGVLPDTRAREQEIEKNNKRRYKKLSFHRLKNDVNTRPWQGDAKHPKRKKKLTIKMVTKTPRAASTRPAGGTKRSSGTPTATRYKERISHTSDFSKFPSLRSEALSSSSLSSILFSQASKQHLSKSATRQARAQCTQRTV